MHSIGGPICYMTLNSEVDATSLDNLTESSSPLAQSVFSHALPETTRFGTTRSISKINHRMHTTNLLQLSNG